MNGTTAARSGRESAFATEAPVTGKYPAAFNPSLAALLFGVGVGAIVQVIVQLVPAIRDSTGRALHPGAVTGLLVGVGALYLTGLLVSV